MTDNDKTGDQLVASVRKTKRAATASRKPTPHRSAAPGARPAEPVAPAASQAGVPEPAAVAMTGTSDKASGYQSVRRVWPD